VKVFDLYAQQYPAIPTVDQIALAGLNVLDGKFSQLNRHILTCFEEDPSLWTDQNIIHISSNAGFDVRPLADQYFFTSPMRFWLAQCVNLKNEGDLKNEAGARPTGTLIVYSEPLFFYSKRLNGYFRFLDIDHEGPISKGEAEGLVESAKLQLQRVFPDGPISNDEAERLVKRGKSQVQRVFPKEIRQMNPDLDLVPCRHYVPAGDGTAALEIRRWFRLTISRDAAIRYTESSSIAPINRVETNMIVLASRSSLGLLQQFQTETPELAFELTGSGIKCRSTDPGLSDVSYGNGKPLAHVLVTNWIFPTGHVHTYLASNHTRALGAVALLLVNHKLLAPICETISPKNKPFPRRFQMVFEVDLYYNDMRAGTPRFLPEYFRDLS
jgi:hypothetical protein